MMMAVLPWETWGLVVLCLIECNRSIWIIRANDKMYTLRLVPRIIIRILGVRTKLIFLLLFLRMMSMLETTKIKQQWWEILLMLLLIPLEHPNSFDPRRREPLHLNQLSILKSVMLITMKDLINSNSNNTNCTNNPHLLQLNRPIQGDRFLQGYNKTFRNNLLRCLLIMM